MLGEILIMSDLDITLGYRDIILKSRETSVMLRDVARHFKLKWDWETPIYTPHETEMFQRVEKVVARYRGLCETYFALTGEVYPGESK